MRRQDHGDRAGRSRGRTGYAKRRNGIAVGSNDDLAGRGLRERLDDGARASVLEYGRDLISAPPGGDRPGRASRLARSGSEYPSEEYDSNCRPSSCSRVIRSVRRRVRRLSRARRVSQGNTEHLPAAEGPRSLRPKWESRSDPPTSYTVKTSRDNDTSTRLDPPAVRELIPAQNRRALV